MRNVSTRLLTLACAALTLNLAACDSGSSKDVGGGAVRMALSIVPGITLNTVSYSINGPASFTKMGFIDVSQSSAISANISPLPPGTGFTIQLSATSVEGDSMCVGSQTFDVVARQTTSVMVHLLCKQPTKFGSVSVNGALNVCPLIDSIGASPSEVYVGASLALSGLAHDIDGGPSPLTYAWTVSPPASGTFGGASSQSSSFSCEAAGPASITLSVSDGDSACVDSQTIVVNCTPAPSTGGAGASGTGGNPDGGAGAGGSGGTSGNGGSGGASGNGGSGGASGGGGSGGTSGSGGSGGSSGGGGSGGTSGSGGSGGTSGSGGSGGSSGTGGSGGSSGSGGTSGAGGAMSCGPGTSGAAVVVYRVGDGSGSLVNTGNIVYLDAFASTPGTPLCSTVMPTAIGTSPVTHRLIASGTATSEGLISRSGDGKYILTTGYDASLGGSTALPGATTILRVVGRVDASGNVDTTTAPTDFTPGNNPRSVASTDGMNLWFGGAAAGVRYAMLGATTSTPLSTTVTNIRGTQIFGGQLYVSSSSGSIRLATVGSGLPTAAGQTITNLTGFPTAGSPYAFYFADLDGNPGIDTVYVADDSTSSPGGITKYSLVSGTWTANGTAGNAADAYRGLTGVVNGTTVTLYATRKGGSGTTGGGELASIVDTGGFNAAFSGTPTLLATAAANTAFRGVALAPTP